MDWEYRVGTLRKALQNQSLSAVTWEGFARQLNAFERGKGNFQTLEERPEYRERRKLPKDFQFLDVKLSDYTLFSRDSFYAALDAKYFCELLRFFKERAKNEPSLINSLNRDLTESNLVDRINSGLRRLKYPGLNTKEIQLMLTEDYAPAMCLVQDPRLIMRRMGEARQNNLKDYFEQVAKEINRHKKWFNSGEKIFSTDEFVKSCQDAFGSLDSERVQFNHWTWSEEFMPVLMLFGLNPKQFAN